MDSKLHFTMPEDAGDSPPPSPSKQLTALLADLPAILTRIGRLTPPELAAEQAQKIDQVLLRLAVSVPADALFAEQAPAINIARESLFAMQIPALSELPSDKQTPAPVSNHERRRNAICACGKRCFEKALALQPKRCAVVNCDRTDLEADHFTPLAKGGHHCGENAIWLCKSHNSSKNDQDPADWASKRRLAIALPLTLSAAV